MNMARASLLCGRAFRTAFRRMTINRFCSSGLQAIALAAERIRGGGAQIILAGGTESMSMMPMTGNKLAPNPWLVDHLPEFTWAWGSPPNACGRSTGSTREDADMFALPATRRPSRRRRRATSTKRSCRSKWRSAPSTARPVAQRASLQEGRRAARGYHSGSAGQTEAGLPGGRHGDGRQLVANQRRRGRGDRDVRRRGRAELGLKPMARFVSFAVAGCRRRSWASGRWRRFPRRSKLAGAEAGRYRT